MGEHVPEGTGTIVQHELCCLLLFCELFSYKKVVPIGSLKALSGVKG